MYDENAKLEPLPTGLSEFHEWSDRIIAKAGLLGITTDSQKYALANIILSDLKPTQSMVPDSYFVDVMRKHAANQVADVVRREIYDRVKVKEGVAAAAAGPKLTVVPNATPKKAD